MADTINKRALKPLFPLPKNAAHLFAGSSIFPGLGALFLSIPIAVILGLFNSRWKADPETAVKASVLLFAAVSITTPLIYLALRRGTARLGDLSLIIVGTVGVLLSASYLFIAASYVFLSADIVIWSESDFVNDILKFRIGYPIFTQQVNNESFTYMPGTQIITYFIAKTLGFESSIPAYRIIQLVFTFLATITAFLCGRRLTEIASPEVFSSYFSRLWSVVWVCLLFLIATNSLTNPFSHLLHNDALALLISTIAYLLLVEFERTKDRRLLWAMALLPAFGLWVKQSLVIWGLIYIGYLLVFTRPVSWKRLSVFGSGSLVMTAISFSAGFLLWGENFNYWTITVLGSHPVSPLRSLRHLLQVWPYFVIGLAGGAVLLRSENHRRLFGLWIVWLALMVTETYTSGIAWMTNHIGPGSLIGGVWALAALVTVWSKTPIIEISNSTSKQWVTTGIVVASAILVFNGLGLVRVPARPFDEQDARRYISQIESEFEGQAEDRVLLDIGTWVYLNDGIVMKDRAPSIGERGVSKTGDFSGIIGRLQEGYYTKILLRNFHSGDFWYDHELWEESSGIREALNLNYREIKEIEPIQGIPEADRPYPFNPISVLIPREK